MKRTLVTRVLLLCIHGQYVLAQNRVQHSIDANHVPLREPSILAQHHTPRQLRSSVIHQEEPTMLRENGTKQTEKNSIFIAIPTRDRIGYVKFTSAVLALSQRADASNVFVFDDCSTQYGVTDLQQMYGAEAHIIRPESCAHNADTTARHIYKFFVEKAPQYDVICMLDSDLVVQPTWEATFKSLLPSTDGVLSLYNSGASWHASTNCAAGVCEKASLGNAGVCMRRDVVARMLQNNANPAFDWGFSTYFTTNHTRMMAIEHSVVAHIGVWGQNSGGKISELALGFNRTALPQWVQDGMRFYLDNQNKPDTVFSR